MAFDDKKDAKTKAQNQVESDGVKLDLDDLDNVTGASIKNTQKENTNPIDDDTAGRF